MAQTGGAAAKFFHSSECVCVERRRATSGMMCTIYIMIYKYIYIFTPVWEQSCVLATYSVYENLRLKLLYGCRKVNDWNDFMRSTRLYGFCISATTHRKIEIGRATRSVSCYLFDIFFIRNDSDRNMACVKLFAFPQKINDGLHLKSILFLCECFFQILYVNNILVRF